MAQALAGLTCRVMQSTSDAAPGLLVYVAHHLGAHHSPDLFHVQHELSKAVSGPLATKQRAAHQAVAEAEEGLKRVHEHLANANGEPNAWCPQCRRPSSVSQGMCGSRCSNWTWRRLRPTPCTPSSLPHCISIAWPRLGR